MPTKMVSFCTILLTALALVPAGAHLFELPNKIGLSQEAYFTVQGIYRGWALFGVVLIGSILANTAFAILLRRQGGAFWLALLASALMVATLIVFFAWTYPANRATSNWTTEPANWRELRVQWEYAHATNAALTFLALGCVTASALLARR